MSQVHVRPTAEEIRAGARAIRRRNVEIVHAAGLGHIGGDLSAADILATLYLAVLNVDPQHPDDPERDRYIQSKGHASGVLYTTLAAAGFIPDACWTPTWPTGRRSTAIRTATRSQGWRPTRARSDTVCRSRSGRRSRPSSTVRRGGRSCCAVTASCRRARTGRRSWPRAIAVWTTSSRSSTATDCSRAPAPRRPTRSTRSTRSSPRSAGRCAPSTATTSTRCSRPSRRCRCESGRPSCVIANTVKGRGVSFIEDRVEWHHKVPNAEQTAQALEELSMTDRFDCRDAFQRTLIDLATHGRADRGRGQRQRRLEQARRVPAGVPGPADQRRDRRAEHGRRRRRPGQRRPDPVRLRRRAVPHRPRARADQGRRRLLATPT